MNEGCRGLGCDFTDKFQYLKPLQLNHSYKCISGHLIYPLHKTINFHNGRKI